MGKNRESQPTEEKSHALKPPGETVLGWGKLNCIWWIAGGSVWKTLTVKSLTTPRHWEAIHFSEFWSLLGSHSGEGNGTPLQYSCLEKSHGQRSLVGCSPWGRWELDMTQWLHFHFSLSCIGEGNGNPLQCSCLENPRDGGAWWAAIYGVAQSWTWLKRLSSSSSRRLVIVFLPASKRLLISWLQSSSAVIWASICQAISFVKV